MRLSQLLESVELIEALGGADPEITGLYYDSRKVRPGGLFFALKGVDSDGYDFIDAAITAGAAAVVTEDERPITGIFRVRVKNGRLAMSKMAATWYAHPAAGVPVTGITGTNGKTTITYLLESILAEGGLPPAVLGTVNYRFGELSMEAPNTTPESIDLQQTLRKLRDAGAKAVVMEVSSHALQQHRVDGVSFDVGVFTNLTRDHLDYHLDMESYLRSKTRLFSELLMPDAEKPRRCAVINTDDEYGRQIARAAACPVISYGIERDTDIHAEDAGFSVNGINCTLVTPEGKIELRSKLVGRFNLYNIMAAVGGGIAVGVPLASIKAGLERHGQVPGRLERVENNMGFTILVDYAHTGDALENVLRTMSELKKGRIITLFGCGGDRDKGKRPIMGEIAGRYSDLSVITSDNPRTEEPSAIIAQIREGISNLNIREYGFHEAASIEAKRFICIEKREDAIRYALKAAQPGDIVLLAGKGHENYQIIGKEKFHFDDREVALQVCREIGGNR